jgi:hypothetical protein
MSLVVWPKIGCLCVAGYDPLVEARSVMVAAARAAQPALGGDYYGSKVLVYTAAQDSMQDREAKREKSGRRMRVCSPTTTDGDEQRRRGGALAGAHPCGVWVWPGPTKRQRRPATRRGGSLGLLAHLASYSSIVEKPAAAAARARVRCNWMKGFEGGGVLYKGRCRSWSCWTTGCEFGRV